MTRDDELHSRISDLAESAEITEITIEKVQARGRRRNLNQRMVALAAAFVLVVGVAGVVRTIGDDEGTLDVAVEAGNDEPDVGGETAGGDTVEESTGGSAPAANAALGQPAPGFAEDEALLRSGPNWVLPWGDGFVSFGQIWHASAVTMRDLVPDLDDRFPQEILDAWAEAGIADGGSVDEATRVLDEAGLLDLATEIIQGDPSLLDAYMEVTNGTYTLEAQVSDDGANWTDLPDFSLPDGNNNLGFVQSDGAHLVVANQDWTEGDESADIEVSITTDLSSWITVTIPVEHPGDIPSFATVNTSLGGLAIGPGGWYVTIERYSWVDLWSLLPAEVTAEMEENGWGYDATPEGIRLESYPESGFRGVDGGFDYPVTPAASSLYPEVPPPIPIEEDWQPTLERLIPWSELGLVYDDYARYLDESAESAAWVGAWDGNLFSATAPASNNCCTVVGTDAGYVAMGWDGYELSGLDRSAASSLYFSRDGHTWSAVSTPATEGLTDSLVAVQDGVLLSTSDESGQLLWRGDAEGTNWELVSVPGLPAGTSLWFGRGGGDGVASVIDVATYDYREPPALVGLDVALEGLTYQGRVTVGDDGLIHLTISYAETGELVFDDVSDWSAFDSSSVIEFLFVGFSAVDGDLQPELEEDFDQLWDTLAAAERDIREQQGWVEPSYEPRFWLVASTDGLAWHVEDLPANPEQYYDFSPPAINGTTVALQMAGEWVTFDIG